MRSTTRVLGALVTLTTVSLTAASLPWHDQAPVAAITPARFVSGWIPNWSGAVVSDGINAINGGHAAVFADASPFAFTARDAITIATSGTEASLTAAVAALREHELPVLPSITDGTGKLVMAGILADPTTRTQHVQAITNLVVGRNYDGIDLDYEGFAFTDGRSSWPTTRPNWAAFVIELGAALHANGKLLSVTVPPIWDNGSSGYVVYSWQDRTPGLDIMPSVDRLRLMVYDWSVASAGAVAPMYWVRNVLAYTKTAVPTEQLRKVQMGVPTYGRSWAKVLSGSCPTNAALGTVAVQMENMSGLLAKPGAMVSRDDSGEMLLTYDEVFTGTGDSAPAPEFVPPSRQTDELGPADPTGIRTAVRLGGATCTIRRIVYYPDVVTVVQRANAALEAGLSGIAIWALGYETADLWPQLTGMDVPRPSGTAPVGSLDAARFVAGGVHVTGWAMDPEFDLPITFTVSINGVMSGPIVARAPHGGLPQFADSLHGFDVVVPTGHTAGTVCLYATGFGAAATQVQLGCR